MPPPPGLPPLSPQTWTAVEHAVGRLWPDGDVPWPRLTPLLAPRVADGRPIEDVVLVAAALGGHAPALAELDALLRAEAARQARLRQVEEAELAQLLRTRLLGEGGRLATWDASGALAAWVRVVTTRLALNLRRDAGREEPVSSPADGPAPATGPETALGRQQQAAHFKAAFAQALATLPPRDRTLLRLSLVDGVPLARLGAMYRRDTSTLSRWLDKARTALADATRAALRERLRLSEAELQSVLRGAEFELSSSFSEWLRSSTGA